MAPHHAERKHRPPTIPWRYFGPNLGSYDQEADTLVVHFYGRDREAEVVLGDGWVDLRVDPDTYDVIGLQIEGYLSDAIFAAPRLIGLAALAGVSSADIEHLRMQWAISEALPSDEALLTA